MRKTLSVIILLALGVALFIYTLKSVGVAQVGKALSLLNVWESIVSLIVLFLGMTFFGAWKWKIIMENSMEEEQVPKFSKILLAKWIGLSVSYITPAALFGGEPVRYYLIKRDKGVPSKQLASSIVLDKLILILVSSVFFFLGFFFLLFYLKLSWLAEAMSSLILFAMLLFFWFLIRSMGRIANEKGLFRVMMDKLGLNKLKFVKKHQESITKVEKEVVLFFKMPKEVIFKTLCLACMEVLFVAFACWLIIIFMGKSLGFGKVLAIKSMVDASYAIPFPAALGSLEISQAFVFKVLGFDLASGVAFSLILRGLTLVIVTVGLLILGWMQIKFFAKNIITFFSRLSS